MVTRWSLIAFLRELGSFESGYEEPVGQAAAKYWEDELMQKVLLDDNFKEILAEADARSTVTIERHTVNSDELGSLQLWPNFQR